jgi:hypothetical protein
METVSPDIAQKILNRDFANIVSRVQSGGKLTRQERAMLQSMAVGAGGDKPDTANSYVELAKILGVTRQSLDRWRKRKDSPKPSANGTHNVVLWREYMKRNDLKGGDPAIPPGELEASLKARRLLADIENREFNLGVRKGDYVALSEVKSMWTELVARATAILRKKFEQELPPIMVGLDATAIQVEASKAIDEVLTTLNQE